MQELELTWKRVISVWWLILWRGGVGASLLGLVLGALNGIAGLVLRWPPATTHLITMILGTLAGIVVGLIAVRMALQKRYGDFRLAIVAREEEGRAAIPDEESRREPHF